MRARHESLKPLLLPLLHGLTAMRGICKWTHHLGRPRANTSPQDIDLLHEIASGLDFSLKYGNQPNFMVCCEKNLSSDYLR